MQRRRRIATKHQPVPLDSSKSRVRLHQPGVSGASGAPQPSEIFCIVGGPQWGAVCLWVRGGFRHAPKLSPALEMVSFLLVLRNNLARKSKSQNLRPRRNATRHTLDVCCVNYVSI